MKKLLLILLSAVLILTFVACSSDKNTDETNESSSDTGGDIDLNDEGKNAEPFNYLANDLTEYIKIGDYKGIEVSKESDVLTEEEFETEIYNLLQEYSYYEEFTDRKVSEGDSVLADYAGYRDGVAFSGGTAKNTTLTAASGTGYIEGFAEAFIGQTPGEEFSFKVTFPENYHNTTLAGVEVEFVCTVHAILGDKLITPELTDEFVTENFNYSNVEEFKIACRKSMQESKSNYVRNAMYTDLWNIVIERSEAIKYPEVEVYRVFNENKTMYKQYAQSVGVDYETFLESYVGITEEKLLEDSYVYVKEDLVMYQLVKELGVEITEEEYNEGIKNFASSYGMSEDEFVAYYGETTIKASLYWQKIMTIISEDAIITGK